MKHFICLLLFSGDRLSIYLTEIYQRPYCRIGPFLVGLLTGHFINRKVQRNFDGYSLTLLIIGHCLCLLGFTYSLFFTYIWRSTVLSYAIYLASSSIIWSASLCWLVFNCVTGQLKFIDRVLSLGSFRPLSRLTYCLYLVHLIVYMIYIYSLPTGLYMSGPIGLAIIMSGLCSVSILLSLPLVLFFEMPSTEIAKHLNSGR